MTLLAFYLVLLLGYSLVSARLDRTVLTAPMLFTVGGLLAAALGVSGTAGGGDLPAFRGAAEIGLVLLLFTDASRTDLGSLRSGRRLPIRLLTLGLLLTIVAGGLAARALFPELTLAEAGILAAILAPTDAGLGQVIVTDERVPDRVRQALNVEAGLNDGLSVPFLLFFLALVASPAGEDRGTLARLVVEQLGYGALVGGGLGLIGGLLLGAADARGWMSKGLAPLGVVAIPLLAVVLSEALHASMFIAAFVAGLAVQRGYRAAGRHAVALAEEWGQVLNLAVFLLFGVIAWRLAPGMRWAHVAYAVASLTLVRMVPVWAATRGARLAGATVAFLGWFGPRGLASIVLGLVYLEEREGAADTGTIRLAVATTVLLSVILHGLSARPGIAWYASRVAALPRDAPERT
jgi:NhaP-type Na+/H+ or K+/H+ antiporter